MIHFQLVTLKGSQYDKDVERVTLPTSAGGISVYEDHMPLISRVTPGIVEVAESPASIITFAMLGGIIEVDGTTVRVLADDVASADNVNAAEAGAAVTRAQQMINEAKNKISLDEAKRQLQYSNVKLAIARKKHRPS